MKSLRDSLGPALAEVELIHSGHWNLSPTSLQITFVLKVPTQETAHLT